MKDDILSSSNINELEPFLSYGTSCTLLNLRQLGYHRIITPKAFGGYSIPTGFQIT